MIHILSRSTRADVPPPLLWREHIRRRMEDCLKEGRSPLRTSDAETWLSRKRRWQASLGEFAVSLKDMPRATGDPRILSERTFADFRLQRIVLESFPGWTVGLNLFLPRAAGRFIPVLCPCGHGPKGLDDHQLPPQVLARNGFAAALFDMPMFGERRRGNDHFIQGAQAWVVGLWSNLFFLIDPIRVADYLHTRSDIDPSRGFGVTGVSGGGQCSLFMPQVDERVSAIAPACCTASFTGHVAGGFYTGCPETYLWGQVAGGMDSHDLAALAAPRPCLVLSGRRDTLFTADNVERAVGDIRKAYSLEGADERFHHVVDDCPHSYTERMARHTVAWFDHWLRQGPGDLGRPGYERLPVADLDCGTAEDNEGMALFIRREAERLRATRTPRTDPDTLRKVLAIRGLQEADSVEAVPPPSRWTVMGLRRRILWREGDLPVPLLELENEAAPEGVLVCVSDEGKMKPLQAAGGLSGIRRHLIAADLRGFGELEPESSDYDLNGWCAIDRSLSHMHYLLGETVLGRQTEDVLRVLAYAGERSTGATIVLYGRGEAALPALFAGMLHERVTRIVLDAFPCCFEALAASPDSRWKHYVFLPGALRFFDIPELIRADRRKAFLLLDPREGMRRSVEDDQAAKLFTPDAKRVTLRPRGGLEDRRKSITNWLDAFPGEG